MKPIRVICITGGKGGVGKTMVSVNLSVAFANLGHKVLLFDADLGLANVDVALGLQTKYNLSHVLQGECDITDVIVPASCGIDVMPASSGNRQMTRLSALENAGIIRAFSELGSQYDLLTIDTAAGINDTVIDFARASQEIIVVVCNEPTSIADAYALIKTLNQENDQYRYHVVANMVKDAQEGRVLFTKITKVTQKFLDVRIDYMGYVQSDEYVRKSVRKRKALLELFPSAPAALNIRELAGKAEGWPMPRNASGHIEFFVEQLVNANCQ